MKRCAFFGHSQKINYEPYRKQIEMIFLQLIEDENVIEFYSGGRGNFDCIGRDILFDIKQTHPHINSYLLLSYHPKPNCNIDIGKYDGSVYLLEHQTLPKFAITRTNECAVEKVDFIVSGVKFSFGGAYRACQYAAHLHKTVLSIFGCFKSI